MGVKVANNAVTATAGAISSTATAVTVTAGTGAQFPILGAGDYFYATLSSTAGVREIVKVTARTDDAMTIVRSQEGTLAQAFPANSRFELRITAASITDMIDEHVYGKQEVAMTNGGTTNGAVGYLLNTTPGTIAAHTIVMPTAPNDADIFVLATYGAITALTITGTTTASPTTLVAGGSAQWVFSASTTRWFKVA